MPPPPTLHTFQLQISIHSHGHLAIFPVPPIPSPEPSIHLPFPLPPSSFSSSASYYYFTPHSKWDSNICLCLASHLASWICKVLHGYPVFYGELCTCKWIHSMYVPLILGYLTQDDILNIHLFACKINALFVFNAKIIFHYENIPHFFYQFFIWGTSRLFLVSVYYE
jgi:hypothetical protein